MLLKPEAVRALSGVSSKKRLMNELGALADAAYAVRHAAAVDALTAKASTAARMPKPSVPVAVPKKAQQQLKAPRGGIARGTMAP